MLIIGIDVGTSGVKALVINEEGDVLGKGYEGYPLITKDGNIVEQDATVWYESACIAVRDATKEVNAKEVRALSMSTQGASSLLVDDDFNPLTNAITWMDGRSVKEKEEIVAALGDDYVYKKTGWRTHHALDACKLLWISKHIKDVYDKAAYFVSTLEYMNFRLTGIGVIDPTNCAIRQLMDINTGRYDTRIIEAVHADVAKLPHILPSGEYLKNLTHRAASDLGLTPNVKVYNGAHDQYCGLYGANIVNNGEMMLSTGTAWVTVGVNGEPQYTKSYISPGPHIVKEKFGALASIPGSGAAFDWVKKNIIKEEYAAIDEAAANRMGKSENLLFYPYLSGAAFPIWDEEVKAAFLGMELKHDCFDLALACMEGVVFQLRSLLDEYPKIKKLSVMGGATQSQPWMEILGAVCGCEVHIMREKDTPCIGAALIAAAGEGLDYARLVRKLNKSVRHPQADKNIRDYYQLKYSRYQKMQKMLFEH